MPTHDFALVGDSNSSAIGRAARKIEGYNFFGGPLGAGRELDDMFFEVRNGDFLFTYERTNTVLRDFTDLLRFEGPILSTLGFNTQRIAGALVQEYRGNRAAFDGLSDAVLDQLIQDYKPGVFAFYTVLTELEHDVYVVPSPQRFPDSYFDIAMRVERLLIKRLLGMGVKIVDVREETTDADGRLREEYATERENDLTHANDDWGVAVVRRFAEMAGLKK